MLFMRILDINVNLYLCITLDLQHHTENEI